MKTTFNRRGVKEFSGNDILQLKIHQRLCNDYRATKTFELKKYTSWSWGNEQQLPFDKLKAELSSDTVMTYFGPHKDIEVITDASPVGISGILTQEDKIVAYASRALTQTESHYIKLNGRLLLWYGLTSTL